MRKIISMILAMAMILTTFGMMSAFAIDPVTFGAYDYVSLNIYNVDFNDTTVAKPLAMMDTGFKDSDGKEVDGPTEGAYVDSTREGAGKAYHITYDTNKTYGTNGTVAARFNGDSDAMGLVEGEKAMVSDCWAMFPSVPTESGKTMQFTSKVKFSGTRQCVTYATSKGDGTMGIGATANSPSVYVNENEWFRYTDIVVFETKMRYVYINGVNIFYQDLSSVGPEITATGYFQLENYKNIPGGIYVDDVHVYLATDVDPNAPVIPEDTSSPYKYSVSGASNNFESDTVGGEPNSFKQLGLDVKFSGKSCMKIINDPEDNNNNVLKFTGDTGTDIYMNIENANNYSIQDTTKNAIVLSSDIYIPKNVVDAQGNSSTNTIGSLDFTWFCSYTSSRAHDYLKVTNKDTDNATLTQGSNSTTFTKGAWHNIQFVFVMSTHTAYTYLDGELMGSTVIDHDSGSGSFVKLDYIRTDFNKRTGTIYFDNWHVCEATTTPTVSGITASNYTAGTTKVGETVTLTAPNFVGGTIQSSTDGKTWTDYAGTTHTLTADSVWFRAKAGNNVTEPTILYGVQPFTERARIYDFIDFEPDGENAYTLKSGSLYTPAGVQVKNTDTGTFDVKQQVATHTLVDNVATATGTYRTVALETVPTTYSNPGNLDVGTTALKLTGDGNISYSTSDNKPTANSQFNIKLAKADNCYPGNTTALDKTNLIFPTPVNANDVYVTEFDFAIDEYAESVIQICGFRTNGNTTSYSPSYWNLYLDTDGKLGLNSKTSLTSSSIIAEATWHRIKVAAYAETGMVETYVDGVLVGTTNAPSKSGSLVWWDSFRLYGGEGNNATTEEVYYDNLNFYIAQEVVASENSNIKLGNIVYKDGNVEVKGMAAYSALNATATVTNKNGAAGSAVIIFARYKDNGKKLAYIDVKKFSVGANQTITVKGDLGESKAGDNVKVFLWDSLKLGFPHDALKSL